MKQKTTTIVTTEVTRRAPRKKTISKVDHIVADGKVYVAEHYAPILGKSPGEGHGITRIDMSEARTILGKGLHNSIAGLSEGNKSCLSTSLLHLTSIRDGLCDMASHPELSLLDKDDCERALIIAVQINEFIPILQDIMTKRVTKFAATQFQAI